MAVLMAFDTLSFILNHRKKYKFQTLYLKKVFAVVNVIVKKTFAKMYPPL